MQLNLTAQEKKFRDEVREFIKAELTSDIVDAVKIAPTVWAQTDKVLEWQRKLNARGWAAPAWPVEYGGQNWSPMQHYIFESECAKAHAPEMIAMSLKMVGPVIARFGTPEQKKYYLPRILDTSDFWCQGFSEPGSGSDLASLSCRAISDGDDYIVNGSKIWTTDAHHANKIFCLLRTSNEAKPQAGISFVLMDMDSPGLSVTPIISISADHEVNQVFFEDVRVPKANLVGEEGQGWTCAKYLLEFERGGGMKSERLKQDLAQVKEIASQQGFGAGVSLLEDPHIIGQIAELEIRLQALTVTELRIIDIMSGGGNPGVASSMLKTEFTEIQQMITELAVDVIGPYAHILERKRPLQEQCGNTSIADSSIPVLPKYLNFRAASIYGGTNEVQRNIIAKAVLGL